MPRVFNQLALFLSLLAILSCIQASTPIGSSASNSLAVVSEGKQGSNFLVESAMFIKDQISHTVSATQNSFRAHIRCNDIRSKQRSFRESLRSEWQVLGLENKVISERLKKVNGGINFDEFVFLQQGREDRIRVIRIVACALFFPKIFPYMIFYLPNGMPSHFEKPVNVMDETILKALSRQRSHGVLDMIINVENKAFNVIGSGLNLNPFASGKAAETNTFKRIAATAVDLLKSGNFDPSTVLGCINEDIYYFEGTKHRKVVLQDIPVPLLKNLNTVITGRNSFVDRVLPGFLVRAYIDEHLKKINEADDFLINQQIDLEKLSNNDIVEACNARLIGTIGRSTEEMKNQLNTWLEQTTIVPAMRVQETGEVFDGHLARTALMAYFALEATKDERSGSVLPRLLFTSTPSLPEDQTS